MITMKKILTAATAVVLAFTASVSAIAAPAQPEQLPESDPCIRIEYTDKEGTPVPGARFTFYKIADYGPDEGNAFGYGFRPLVDGVEVSASTDAAAALEKVRSAYEKAPGTGRTYIAVTGPDGTAELKTEPGAYIAEETEAAQGYIPSVPFILTVPAMSTDGTLEYAVTARPKPLAAGSLTIRKYLKGNNVDGSREWHFTVELDAEGEFQWTRSDGTSGTVKNGGKVILTGGQSVEITGIPSGTAFSVSEDEAGKDGYKTYASGASGHIAGNKAVVFLNEKSVEETTGDEPGTGSTKPRETSGNTTPTKSGTTYPTKSGTSNSTKTGSTTKNPVKTGDSTRTALWGGMFVLVTASVVIVLLVKRRLRDREDEA